MLRRILKEIQYYLAVLDENVSAIFCHIAHFLKTKKLPKKKRRLTEAEKTEIKSYLKELERESHS